MTQSRFCCNAHTGCKRLLRVYLNDGKYTIQGSGEHGLEPNLKKRKNSTLSFEEEARVRESMDQGGRSAGLRVAMTTSKARELKEAGLIPEDYKNEEGGLTGSRLPCWGPEYAQNTFGIHPTALYPNLRPCIPDAFRMYPERSPRSCILDTFWMYPECILHVSCMYPACILNVPREYVFSVHSGCILHVSCMYPACILNVPREYVFSVHSGCILSVSQIDADVFRLYGA